MFAKVLSGAVVGVDGLIIEVEVDLIRGLPSFSTVGLAEGAVRESKDRVKAAIKNCGYDFADGKVTVNLAPATVKKEGAGYDLPIALGVLAVTEQLACTDLQDLCVVGELSLDGEVRKVRGILPMVLAAKERGVKRFYVPAANAEEAAIVEGIEVVAVRRLEEAVAYLSKAKHGHVVSIDMEALFTRCNRYSVDMSEVKGQEHVKRAMEVAAAGGHNILLSGVPGTGKTMIARRLPTILPDQSIDEALETTKIYSTMGLLPDHSPLMVTRPFRAPHHTISDAGLIGGGNIPRPGEVSMAHNGVLFLDELPEFRKHVLEVMRQPMEDGVVSIARASSSMQFPAGFMLVAAMNPCPCGYLGDHGRDCSCSAVQVQRYRAKISGPLLDRIDMHVEVPPVGVNQLVDTKPGEPSEAIRERVNKARAIQQKRFSGDAEVHGNASMKPRDITSYCQLDTTGASLLKTSIEGLGLSARAHNRILKIARTIADLDFKDHIESSHIAQAVQYRRMRYHND